MLKNKTIGFIGVGNMGEALMGGLIDSGMSEPARILCSDVRQERLKVLKDQRGVRICLNNLEVIQKAEIIIYAVKPQIISKVVEESSLGLDETKTVISIAAGVTIQAIESLLLKKIRLIRAMPNVCAMIKEGITAIVPGTYATSQDLDLAHAVFNSVGRSVLLKDEDLMDAVTGLSGSGPAYFWLILETLADGGVKMGLPRQEALLFASQTMLGAAKFFLESNKHPAQLKDMVTSPGGTTIAGLHALEKGGLRFALMDAVEAATLRSKALGRMPIRKPQT